MSDQIAGTDGETPTARKRAAKKTATKTAAKSVPAKKAPTKKVAAKKVAAKKVAGKSAANPESNSPELPFSEPITPKAIPAPEPAGEKPAKISRARKTAKSPVDQASEHQAESASTPSDESPRRFGRVPGGGPVAPREPAPQREQGPQDSTPFPQPPSPPNREGNPPAESRQEHERQPQGHHGQNPQQRDGQGPPRESRSKRRREKRKRRKNERGDQGGQQNPQHRHRNEGGDTWRPWRPAASSTRHG